MLISFFEIATFSLKGRFQTQPEHTRTSSSSALVTVLEPPLLTGFLLDRSYSHFFIQSPAVAFRWTNPTTDIKEIAWCNVYSITCKGTIKMKNGPVGANRRIRRRGGDMRLALYICDNICIKIWGAYILLPKTISLIVWHIIGNSYWWSLEKALKSPKKIHMLPEQYIRLHS